MNRMHKVVFDSLRDTLVERESDMIRIFETSRRLMIARTLGFMLVTTLICAFMIASTLPTRAATNDVWLLQRDLAGLGYMPMSGIDGIYGENTAASTRAFQSDNGLQVDG